MLERLRALFRVSPRHQAETATDDPLLQVRRAGGTPHGIVHVGANDGHEFKHYRKSGVAIAVYIEPLPDVFEKLKRNLKSTPGHHAVCALIADADGREVDFHVASNRGQSSSMFPLGRHKVMFPDIAYVDTIRMRTRTLDSVLAEAPFGAHRFDFLVMDVQGAELKVLQGAERLLADIDFVYTEASEKPLYEGACTLGDIVAQLDRYGLCLDHFSVNDGSWGNAFFRRR
jgi:FkbM family methyltransferase